LEKKQVTLIKVCKAELCYGFFLGQRFASEQFLVLYFSEVHSQLLVKLFFYFPPETSKSQHCPLYSNKKPLDTSRQLVWGKLRQSPKKLLWTLFVCKGEHLRSLPGNKGGVRAVRHNPFGNKLYTLKPVERQVMPELDGTDPSCLTYMSKI